MSDEVQGGEGGEGEGEPKRRFSQEQYEMLMRCSEAQDITEWNEWRKANPDTEILLEWANLVGADLEGAWLEAAHLAHADLEEAHLEGARLAHAHLEGADLNWAHLEQARLFGKAMANRMADVMADRSVGGEGHDGPGPPVALDGGAGER